MFGWESEFLTNTYGKVLQREGDRKYVFRDSGDFTILSHTRKNFLSTSVCHREEVSTAKEIRRLLSMVHLNAERQSEEREELQEMMTLEAKAADEHCERSVQKLTRKVSELSTKIASLELENAELVKFRDTNLVSRSVSRNAVVQTETQRQDELKMVIGSLTGELRQSRSTESHLSRELEELRIKHERDLLSQKNKFICEKESLLATVKLYAKQVETLSKR